MGTKDGNSELNCLGGRGGRRGDGIIGARISFCCRPRVRLSAVQFFLYYSLSVLLVSSSSSAFED